MHRPTNEGSVSGRDLPPLSTASERLTTASLAPFVSRPSHDSQIRLQSA